MKFSELAAAVLPSVTKINPGVWDHTDCKL